MPLTLLIPDLLPPADAPASIRSTRLPALEKWLARADLSRAAAPGRETWLEGEYGLERGASHAAIALAGEDGSAREGTWAHADPVHLRIDRDNVALHDASVLDLGAHESADLLAALQAHFAPDGLAFSAPTPERWYVQMDASMIPRAAPLAQVIGRNIFGQLPEATPRFNWRSALTEAQMVLSTHAANAAREREGRPAVNGIWVWGGGTAPARVAARFTRVFADDPWSKGLGVLSGAAVQSVPASLDALPSLGMEDEALAVVDATGRSFRAGDPAAWTAAARDLDAHWFDAIGRALPRFGAIRLVLPAEESTVVASLVPSARWKWFAPRRPWTSHA